MPINDDDIRQAFAWPVRYNRVSHMIDGSMGQSCLIYVQPFTEIAKIATTQKERDDVLAYLGEVIAEMLNERYAPKGG